MLRVSSVFIRVKEATMVKFGARGGSIVEMAQAFFLHLGRRHLVHLDCKKSKCRGLGRG